MGAPGKERPTLFAGLVTAAPLLKFEVDLLSSKSKPHVNTRNCSYGSSPYAHNTFIATDSCGLLTPVTY